MSVRVSTSNRVAPACSGLMYSGVPSTMPSCGVQRAFGEPERGGFRDAEVDHLRDGLIVLARDQDVRRLEVAMDDALLVRVLDGGADLQEQLEARRNRQAICRRSTS